MGYNPDFYPIYKLGYNPLILTIDSNFLGHPSRPSFATSFRILERPGGEGVDPTYGDVNFFSPVSSFPIDPGNCCVAYLGNLHKQKPSKDPSLEVRCISMKHVIPQQSPSGIFCIAKFKRSKRCERLLEREPWAPPGLGQHILTKEPTLATRGLEDDRLPVGGV